MKKNMKNILWYFTLVVMFCVIISGVGGYYIGTSTTSSEEKVVYQFVDKENEGIFINGNIKFPDYNGEIYKALYYYLESGEDNLTDYLKSLDNNKKLYVGGIISEETVYGSRFNNNYYWIKANLENIFGDDLGVEAKDYYISSLEPTYIINTQTYEYSLNEGMAGDILTDFGEYYIYNYEVNNIEYTTNGYKITYLGLYKAQSDISPAVYTNNSNINVDSSEIDTDIDTYLSKHEDELLKFTYEYTKVDGNYVLTGFNQE